MNAHNDGGVVRKAAETAAAMRVDNHIYAIVPARGPVTFHSQQRRAFNLVWSLAETKEISGRATIGVVGGGLTGLTVAAAASMLGCTVTLFESGHLPFHEQRGNATRFIHPNILDWPRAGALEQHTNLPYLNWSANNCDGVIREVEAQWKTVPNVAFKPSRTVSGIKSKATGARVTVSVPFDQLEFDCVIACVGFGKERTFGEAPGTTYWQNDELHQVSDNRHFLITGTGDGGLIDLMRLVITDFEHGRIWESVASHPPLQELGQAILDADEEARAVDEADAGSALMAAYTRLKLEERFPESLRTSIRSNAHVTLNGTGKTPFELSASILNRVLTYALLRWAAIEYIDGRLLPKKHKAKKNEITFDRITEPRSQTFDRIVVRHGPSGQFAKLFGKEVSEQFLKPTAVVKEAGIQQFWPDGYFEPPPFGPEYLKLTYGRAAAYFSEFERLALREQGSGVLVHIEKNNDHATYVVTTSSALRPGPAAFARIPVIYKRVDTAKIEPTLRIDQGRYRPLVCGVGIQNHNRAREVHGDKPGIAFSGTLGCFVETANGQPAILSALHVLAGDAAKPQVGDLIVQAPGTSDVTRDAIAKLEKYIEIEEDPSLAGPGNFFDVGVASLISGVEFVPAFQPSHQLPLPKGVREEQEIVAGEEVWMVGAGSGLQRVVVSGIILAFKVMYHGRPLVFRNCLMLRKLDGKKPTRGGNSGGYCRGRRWIAAGYGFWRCRRFFFGVSIGARAREAGVQTHYLPAVVWPSFVALVCRSRV